VGNRLAANFPLPFNTATPLAALTLATNALNATIRSYISARAKLGSEFTDATLVVSITVPVGNVIF
jgi:hypothetical protein